MNIQNEHGDSKDSINEINKEKGYFKIFLGYAPGVGKTYSMLVDANKKLSQGEDIVIGYIETHKRMETEIQVCCLETIPRKKIEYNNLILEEMDTETIISLHPNTVLIDELAHTNVPGSKHKKRYEDVLEILDNGINVTSTVNIQHLESLNDVVKQITGINIKETIPDKMVENADEIVVVDITPYALRNRLKRGNVYKIDVAERALKNFFREGNLNALREFALRQTADEVNENLTHYVDGQGGKNDSYSLEYVMVCITSGTYSKKLIRRGARIAKTYKCPWIVVDVYCTHIFATKLNEKDLKTLDENRTLARELGADVVTLKGKSVSSEITKFIEERHITQVILGHSQRSNWEIFLRGSTISKLIKFTENVEFHIIPN
jgi:two-component system sensor histidine kinase KdpD